MKDWILVTGGSGFLGINMIRYLRDKGEKKIRTIDIAPFDYPEKGEVDAVLGDVRDMDAVRKCMKDVKWVIHTAAALPLYSEKDIYTTEVDGIDMPQSSTGVRFLITPNPAHGNITLSGLVPGAAVAIRDASGRTVMSFKVKETQEVLSIDDLMPGVYFVTASTPTANATRKLIVR